MNNYKTPTQPHNESKWQKAKQHPERILPYLWTVLRRKLFIRTVHQKGQKYYQYKKQLYPAYLANHAAAPFILDTAKKFCRGKGIDIGAGTTPFPGANPIQNAPDQNAYKLDRYTDNSLDYIFSSHCLEHLDRWQDALRLWTRKLKPHGILFLYLPHESMLLWRPGGLWAGSDHKWPPNIQTLIPFLREQNMDITDHNPSKDKYFSFHIAARKQS